MNLELIKDAVCDIYGISRVQLKAKDRTHPTAIARNMYCLVARSFGFSFPAVGRSIGRDHSTIMNGCKKAADEIFLYPAARKMHEKIMAAIKASVPDDDFEPSDNAQGRKLLKRFMYGKLLITIEELADAM